MTRLTDEEIDLELKSDSWTTRKLMAAELKELRAENARLRVALQKMRSNLHARAEELEDEMHGDDGFMNNYSEMSGERLAYLDVILQLDKISTPSTQTENVREALTKIGELK